MDSLTPINNDDEDNEDSPDYLEPDFLACLNVRQRSFVEEFIKNKGNATKAALKAGYSSSTASAAVIGHRLLRNVKVSAAIDKLLQENTLSTNQVLSLLSGKAQASIEPFVQAVGRSLMMDFNTPKARAALHTIKKYKVGRYGPEIEFHDPIRAAMAIEQIRSKKPGKMGDEDPEENDEQIKVVAYLPSNGRWGNPTPNNPLTNEASTND